MRFCEQCRQKNNWPKNKAFPFVGLLSYAQCEVCRKQGETHEVDSREIFKKNTDDEKRVDSMRNMLYRNFAEELAIYFETGPKAGRINEHETAELKKILVQVDGQVDWEATYNLRLVAKNAAQSEALKRRK